MVTQRHFIIMLLVVPVLLSLSFSRTNATPIVLSQVPAYDWYHGCGPTAAASLIGYWDLNGYPNLFDVGGWDEIHRTLNVQDQISSPEHNARYDPTPDDMSKPQSWNSIADWFHTSEDPLNFGWSYQSYADNAFEGYANYRGYEFNSYYESWGTFIWDDLVDEIDMGNPIMFLVDTDGNGGTDHFVPVFGYDDRDIDGLWYALYTTWSEEETIVWHEFQAMGEPWGVGYGTFVHPVSAPIPEPSTILFVSTGLACLFSLGRRKSFGKRIG